MRKKRLFTLATLIFLAILTLALRLTQVVAQTSNIAINGTSSGLRFDGIGGLSGGGGTSRLLWDYPPQQMNEILDYLFKPNYGASLHILKVEIGSDANSTNGSEASHERTRGNIDCTRGYEWWLMQQAKQRNPNIKLWGLMWGAPGWFNGGVWTSDHVQYIVDWLNCAKNTYGLHIDYMGGLNESGGGHQTFFKNLYNALQTNFGSNAPLLEANDNGWEIVQDMQADPTFAADMYAIGWHYPCGGDGAPATTCDDTTSAGNNAQSLGKPMWATEHGSQPMDTGSMAWARAVNRDYIDSRLTLAINWTLVYSWYGTLGFPGDGLVDASQPWSGYYDPGKSTWVTAHTTQFAQPGWKYLDSGSGYLQGNRANGSYVTLKSPNNSDYSVVIETMDATASQTASFSITGGLSTGQVHVWASNLNSSDPTTWFVHQTDITPTGGSYSLTLQPHYMYSITTTTGQGRGVTTPPAWQVQSLPFSDNFQGYAAGKLPKYFAAEQGAFETATCGGGRSGMCMRQIINVKPFEWGIGSPTPPIVVVGDPHWADYQVTTDALWEQSTNIDLVGRLEAVTQFGGGSQGYHLRVTDGGTWTLLKEDGNKTDTTLMTGSQAIGLNTWHTLSLRMQGSAIQAFIDGTSVASVTDSTYSGGQVGLLVGGWQNAQFSNFSVTAVGSTSRSLIDDQDPQVSYTGAGWQHGGCSPNCYNNTNSWDNTVNDALILSFTGTQIQFYGVKDPGHGIGAVSIDGGAETSIDFYAATRAGQQLLWTSPVLTNGSHTFKLRVTGTKNASSSNTWVVPDAFGIISSSLIDDQDPGVSYTGAGWQHGGCSPNCYNNTNSWDNTINDSLTLSFIGTQIQFYGVKDPAHGMGAVSIDGGSETTIDFYSATRAGQQLLWTSPVLISGSHTFKLRVTGAKNASSSNTWVVPDAFGVISSGSGTATPTFVPPTLTPTFVPPTATPTGGTITTVDDRVTGAGQNQFNYAGAGWQSCTNCGADLYAGTNSWDNTTNDSVTVAFTGTQIKFYGVKDPQHGIGAVSIDGGAETTIDFYAATRAGNTLLWTSPVLTSGSHTFKLRVTGTKNAGSSNTWVVPDRVDIVQ